MPSTSIDTNKLSHLLFGCLIYAVLVNMLVLPKSWLPASIENLKIYGLILSSFGCWLVLLLDKQATIKFFKIDLIILAFVVWNFCSYTWATNPSLTLEKSFSWLFLFSIYKLSSSFKLVDKKFNYLNVSIASALGVSLFFLSWCFYLFAFRHGNFGISHIELKSVGQYLNVNANSVASILVLTMPVYIMYYYQRKQRTMIALMILLQFMFIILLNSRASTFALIIQLVIFCLLNAKHRKKIAQIAFLVFIVLLSTLLFIDDKKSFFEQYNPLKGISVGHDERLVLWRASTDTWQQAPLVGVGAGNWIIEYPKYAQNIHFGYDKDQYYSHPHNIFMQIVSELGGIGLILYLFIIFYFLRLYYRLIRAKQHDVLPMVLLLISLGYLILSFFYGVIHAQDEVPVIHQVIFWIIMGIGISVSNTKSLKFPFSITNYLFVLFSLFFTSYFLYTGHKRSLFKEFQHARKSKNYTTALQLFDKAYDKRLYTMDGHRNKNTALKTSEAMLRFYKQRDVEGAIKAIEQALQDQPNYHVNFYHLGIFLKKKGDLNAAKECFEKVFELKNSYFKAQLELIKVSILQEDRAQAQKWFDILNDRITFLLSKYAQASQEQRALKSKSFHNKCLNYKKQLKVLELEIRNI